MHSYQVTRSYQASTLSNIGELVFSAGDTGTVANPNSFVFFTLFLEDSALLRTFFSYSDWTS